MTLFGVTRKLAAALGTKLSTSVVEPENADHEWFADLFFVERKKCVIWVHRTTLLTFVRPAVVAAELRQHEALFRHELKAALASLAMPESLVAQLGGYDTASYAPTNDRGIVGSMLDYRKMFGFMVEYDGGLMRADIAVINAKLNHSPMSVLGMDSADRVLLKLAGCASDLH